MNGTTDSNAKLFSPFFFSGSLSCETIHLTLKLAMHFTLVNHLKNHSTMKCISKNNFPFFQWCRNNFNFDESVLGAGMNSQSSLFYRDSLGFLR